MRTLATAIIVGCTLCAAGHTQEKLLPSADRLLEKCIKIMTYGQVNEFDKPAKEDAVIALGMLGDDRAVPGLLEHLHNENDKHLQFQIIRAAGWIKSAKAVPALEKFLQRKDDPARREAAMFALEAITGKDYGSQERLRRPLEGLQDLLRDVEVSGLGGRKDSPGCPALEVGKAYRFVFARADVKDLVALLVERPRDGWAKVQQAPGEGQAVSWIHLTAVVMIVPAAEKK
jgi:HEAT repeat protein